ncbi:tetratricopeptide repeat protein [Schlegelella sp. ID0723]|uniref:Tetratricopeptide repeat protein n=2 Tax=Piscinibacter koreensis TaxID=2742824 RepID=A0A7Y6NRA5_9BURK|nr:tetratricopeptide repeat protein [Schlegelella koreensis]NUZ07856.1 tetratricopeptide repeat protein [Schlegelella koreensis]
MLGISRAVVTSLVRAGFVTPTRGARNEYRFGFRDVVLLRTAYGLQAANMSHRRIVRALERLRATLPESLPLSGLRVTAVGNDIAVRDGAHQVAAESGQLLLDFEVAPVHGAVTFLQPAAPRASSPEADELGDDAGAWFARAEAAEASDPAAAEAAYRRAIELAPCYADAYLNLGALLHDQGRFAAATRLYDDAIVRCPDAALLHFNRALALEDEGRVDEAIASYERAVALAPDLADAHFNAARLYERSGDTQKALRHFNAYRRLQR